MATDDKKPMIAVNTGRVVWVPPCTTWVSEIVVKTGGDQTGN